MEADGRVWQSPGSCVITNDPCPRWFPGHWAFELPEVNNIVNCVSTLPNAIDFLDLRSPGQMSQTRFSQSLLILCVSILFTIFVSLHEAPTGCRKPATGTENALKSVYGTIFDVTILFRLTAFRSIDFAICFILAQGISWIGCTR